MNTSTHLQSKVPVTPGPWFASAVKSNYGVFHVSAQDGTGVANAFEWSNAKVIAAVPDMLETLRTIAEENEALGTPTAMRTAFIARAALAKVQS